MESERNIPVALDREELLARLGAGRPRRGRGRDFTSLADEICDILPGLLQPAVSWSLTTKTAIGDGGRVHLREPESGIEGTLQIGERFHYLEPAREVALAVKTIGPLLEEEVRRLEGEDPLRAYILDVAGVMALDRVSDWFRSTVEDLARSRGWKVSPSLLPGSLKGWSVEGQREICRFLDLEGIGVSLNGFSVLRPHKSDSVAIGMGPDYTEEMARALCSECDRRETCPWRR